MTFLKYIFNRTKPCLHNVKELASDRRSEKNLAKAERARPWTVKGARVLSDVGADPSEGRLPDPWNPGDPLRAGASLGAGPTGRTADQSLAWRSPRVSAVLWPRPHGCPRHLAIHSTNADVPRGGKRNLLRTLQFWMLLGVFLSLASPCRHVPSAAQGSGNPRSDADLDASQAHGR